VPEQVVHHGELAVAAVLVGDVAREAGDGDDFAALDDRLAGHPNPPSGPVGRPEPVVDQRRLAAGEPLHRSLDVRSVLGMDRVEEDPRLAFQPLRGDVEHLLDGVVDEQEL
jgi:hypothetical protein